jgi:hypothetical protein
MNQQGRITSSLNGATLGISAEGGLSFVNGAGHWEHQGPLLLLNYYDRQHPRAQRVALPSATSVAFGTAGTLSLSCTGTFEAEETEPGRIEVRGTFKEAQIEISLQFSIEVDGSGFRVAFAWDQIAENHPRLYRVLSVELLPEFNAAVTGESGYLVLPNWSGTQMFFDKDISREQRQTVYSSNDQWEYCCNMPVFGVHRQNGTMAALITSGENDAKLVCRQHYERARTNSIHPEMVLRWQQEDEPIDGMREVRYRFAASDSVKGEAYVFVAKQYRDWLYREKGLQTWRQKATTRPEAVDYRDRFFLKFFMAYKEPHPDGKGAYHATATFAEVREILEDLLANGVTRLCAILVGWNIDGHDGMPPTRMPVDERLGGESAMRELVAWCKEQDIMLGIHDSYGAAYSCSPEFDVDDLIRHRSGEYWESVIWSGGQAHRICPAVFLKKYVRRDMGDVANLGVHGHHHIDAVGSFMPCYSEAHPLPLRSQTIDCSRKMFQIATEIMGSVSTEMPFGSYFDVIDGVYHCYRNLSAWHQASPAALFRDRSIPLLNIALHGSVKLCMGMKSGKDTLSQMAAWGIAPQWEVAMRTSPHFGIVAYPEVREQLIEGYQRSYGEAGYCLETEALLIEDYRETDDDRSEIEFENGLVLEVANGTITIKNLPMEALV